MVAESLRRFANKIVPKDPRQVLREEDGRECTHKQENAEIVMADRKLVMGVYIIKLISVFGIFEFMIYATFRKLMGFENDEVITLLTTVNLLLVPGWGITQFIFTGGNVGEWKYRSPYEGGYRYGGQRDYVPAYGKAPKDEQTGQLPVEDPMEPKD